MAPKQRLTLPFAGDDNKGVMLNRAFPSAILSILAFATAGCGLAEYEQLMADRLVTLRKESAFDQLDQPEPISPQHAPWIRIPKLFSTAQGFFRIRDPAAEKNKPKPKEGDQPERTPEEQADESGTPLDFLRELPGFGRVAVRTEQVDRTQLASYYYLAVIEQTRMKPADVRSAVQKAVRAQWPNLSGDWQAATVESPDGKNIPVHRLVATGKMPFDRYAAINRNAPNFPGTLALYCLEHPAYTVLWGVRVPDAVNETIGLVRQAEAAAATIDLRDPQVESSEKK
jgi:hypothetical protein